MFLFYVSLCFCCFRLVFLSFCIYNRKNIYKNITKQNNSKENKKTLKKTEISQPEPERYLFAVGSRAGYPVDSLQKVGKVGKVKELEKLEKRLLPTY